MSSCRHSNVLIVVIGVIHMICLCSSQWISVTNPRLPRTSHYQAVGSYNDVIFLLGGYGTSVSTQLFEYGINTNTFTDHGNNVLEYSTYGSGDFYTQRGDTIYMLSVTGSNINAFDMTTKTFISSWKSVDTPVSFKGCLTSTDDYLYVVGGYNSMELNTVQVLDVSAMSWLSNIPSMITARNRVSCVADPSTMQLYVIGGVKGPTNVATNFLNTIEKINLINIELRSWEIIPSTLSQRAIAARSIVYEELILVIGGRYNDGNGYHYVDTMHVIDPQTDAVTLPYPSIPTTIAETAPIIMNNILYVFGGSNSATSNSGIFDTFMTFQFSTPSPTWPPDPTASPTKEPTIGPTSLPTKYPTHQTPDPSADPTIDPTINPTTNPTLYPTMDPTLYPTINPTTNPSLFPTNPTTDPTSYPTLYPTTYPTSNPTTDPTTDPTSYPTTDPTTDPITDPTTDPTSYPTKDPTLYLTTDPTIDPTIDPTKQPTNEEPHQETTSSYTSEFVTTVLNITLIINGSISSDEVINTVITYLIAKGINPLDTDIIQQQQTVVAVFEISHELDGDEINSKEIENVLSTVYDGRVTVKDINVKVNPSHEDSDKKPNKSNGPLIIALSMVSLAIIIIYLCWRTQRKRKRLHRIENNMQMTQNETKTQNDTLGANAMDSDVVMKQQTKTLGEEVDELDDDQSREEGMAGMSAVNETHNPIVYNMNPIGDEVVVGDDEVTVGGDTNTIGGNTRAE